MVALAGDPVLAQSEPPPHATTATPSLPPVATKPPAQDAAPAAAAAQSPAPSPTPPAPSTPAPASPSPAAEAAPPATPVQPAGPLAEAIAARLASGLGSLDSWRTPDGDRLRQFYQARHYAAAWFADSGNGNGSGALTLQPPAQTLLQVLAGAEADGLLPADYHPAAIQSRLEAGDPVHRAELDLLLTDALMDYAGDLHHGRLPPHAIAEEFALVPPALDAVQTATAALSAPDLGAFLAGLAPANPDYARLREALRIMRGHEAAGGWPRVPEGDKLEPGTTEPAVRALRRRLAVTGDLDPQLPVTPNYDKPLKAAVMHFQARHGLEADGVVGATTLTALNVGVSERVASLIANMERQRWMPPDLGPRHVLVNIPSFNLKVVEDGKVVHEMPVIVGTKVRRTPIFSSAITSLIWNPTWSVPAKLAREDILPKLRQDPGYLAEQHIVLYDGSFSGGRVNPANIDWQTVHDINRFRLRQMPGVHNALGQVKFNIPNDFDVYLHDTPHREKFVKTVRTFSSGCVRVGDPMALADFVLTDMPEWPLERRAEALKKGDTRFVTLRTPVPVFLLYQTAWVDLDGTIEFREDIYGRDAQVMHALRRTDESVAKSVGAAG